MPWLFFLSGPTAPEGRSVSTKISHHHPMMFFIISFHRLQQRPPRTVPRRSLLLVVMGPAERRYGTNRLFRRTVEKRGISRGRGTLGLPRPRRPDRPEIRNTAARSRVPSEVRQDGGRLVPAPEGRKKADVATSAFVVSILEYRSRCRCIAPFGVVSEQSPNGGGAPSRSSD